MADITTISNEPIIRLGGESDVDFYYIYLYLKQNKIGWCAWDGHGIVNNLGSLIC